MFLSLIVNCGSTKTNEKQKKRPKSKPWLIELKKNLVMIKPIRNNFEKTSDLFRYKF